MEDSNSKLNQRGAERVGQRSRHVSPLDNRSHMDDPTTTNQPNGKKDKISKQRLIVDENLLLEKEESMRRIESAKQERMKKGAALLEAERLRDAELRKQEEEERKKRERQRKDAEEENQLRKQKRQQEREEYESNRALELERQRQEKTKREDKRREEQEKREREREVKQFQTNTSYGQRCSTMEKGDFREKEMNGENITKKLYEREKEKTREDMAKRAQEEELKLRQLEEEGESMKRQAEENIKRLQEQSLNNARKMGQQNAAMITTAIRKTYERGVTDGMMYVKETIEKSQSKENGIIIVHDGDITSLEIAETLRRQLQQHGFIAPSPVRVYDELEPCVTRCPLKWLILYYVLTGGKSKDLTSGAMLKGRNYLNNEVFHGCCKFLIIQTNELGTEANKMLPLPRKTTAIVSCTPSFHNEVTEMVAGGGSFAGIATRLKSKAKRNEECIVMEENGGLGMHND